MTSLLLATWRQHRRDGTLAGQARGRKGKDARDKRIEELENIRDVIRESKDVIIAKLG